MDNSQQSKIDYFIARTDQRLEALAVSMAENNKNLSARLEEIAKFRYLIIGGGVAVSAIVTILFNFLILLFDTKH